MCFMAIDDLDEGSKKDKWFLDSGCSRHMTGDESKFAFLTERKGGYIIFGDNAKGRIIGQGNIDRRQQEEIGEDPKKEESPLTLPPPQQVQGKSSQYLHKDWNEFEMSMMGELNFFLGLQIKQLKERTFINQAKYIRDLFKRFNMEEAKTMKTPMSSSIKLDMDKKGKPVNSTMYRGMIGHSLVSWHSKKQNSVALSTVEAEYIAGFGFGTGSPLSARLSHLQLHFRELRAFDWVRFLLIEIAAFRAQGKHPIEPSQPNQTKMDEIATSIDDFRADFLDFGASARRAFVAFSTSLQLDSGCGHRDEVSYLEAFLIDSILTGRRIHVGYLMMMHMISCCESTTEYSPTTASLLEYSRMPGLI
ncbi:hypothetical protein AAG906_040550 [Vitis piasezkii]